MRDWQRDIGDRRTIEPRWDVRGVPWCSRERCCAHDGVVCRELRGVPDRICEVAVIEMAREVAP